MNRSLILLLPGISRFQTGEENGVIVARWRRGDELFAVTHIEDDANHQALDDLPFPRI
jgi:hypothetical protein